MNEIYALFMTLLVGLFILLGTGIIFMTKNNDKIVQFSISMAFGVMVMLSLFELIPESYELLSEHMESSFAMVMMVGLILIGIFILKLLDHFIPDHEVEQPTKKEIEENLLHIGMVSSIALLLHNMIEGMAIYSSVLRSTQLGFLVCLGVGLHNIPLGMVISSTIYKANHSMKKTLGISFLLSISTFLGGMMIYLFRGQISSFVQGIFLAMTLGMILYIVLFELLPHIIHEKDRKTTIVGMLFGAMILFISILF